MEVSKLCFICFKEGSLNSNATPNGVVTVTQENVRVVEVRGIGGKFATRSRQYFSLNDSHDHNGLEEQEVSPSQDVFGFVCGECETKLDEFCEMHAQLQDIQKKINGKVGEISEVMTKAEHENERKEEFETYQRCLQLQRKRRGQSCVDLSGFRKDFLQRVQVLNLVSKPHPVADGSIASGSKSTALHNEVMDANSSSSFARVESANQPSDPDSGGSSGIQILCNSPSIASADSTVARKNQVVTRSRSLGDSSSAAIAKKSILASIPHPVADGSISSGSTSKTHNNEVVGSSSPSVDSHPPLLDSLSSGFVTVQSAQKPSHSLTEGSGQTGMQNVCLNSSVIPADSEVAHRNEVVTAKSDSMVQLEHSSGIAKKSVLVSSNSAAKSPIRKRNRVKHHCVFCGKYFVNLNLHIITHTKEKWYGCKICGNEFSVKAHLFHHTRTHTGVKLYECEICKKRLTTRTGKKAHLRVHTGAKPFKCQYCPKIFAYRSSWRKHNQIIHERKQTK